MSAGVEQTCLFWIRLRRRLPTKSRQKNSSAFFPPLVLLYLLLPNSTGKTRTKGELLLSQDNLRKRETSFQSLLYFHSEGSFIVSRDEKDRGERRRLFLQAFQQRKNLAATSQRRGLLACLQNEERHEEIEMRPACFSNWKTRGFCVDECPHKEACLEESSAVLPLEVWRLVGNFESRQRLDSRGKSRWELGYRS